MEKEIEPYYRAEAKRFTDSMFDAKVFSEKLTRDDIQGYEDLLAYYMQSHAYSAQKIADFSARFNLSKEKP